MSMVARLACLLLSMVCKTLHGVAASLDNFQSLVQVISRQVGECAGDSGAGDGVG